MGYYTRFNMDVPANGPSTEELAGKLVEVTGDGNARHYWYELLEDGSDDTKWYDHTSNMREVSKHWPDVLFTLSGEGERNGDKWVEYHLNGQVHIEEMPEWTAPAFDLAKLS